MPKETISGTSFDIEVRWGNDQMLVQVASVMKPAMTSESPASLGTLVETWDDMTRYTATGLFTNLERRQQINDLIRVLRRARDSAFGADA